MGMGRPELALLSAAGVLGISMLLVVGLFPDRVKPVAGPKLAWHRVVIDTFRISPKEHGDFLWLMASRLAILVAIAGLQRYAIYYFKDVFYPGSGLALEEHASIAARDLQVVIVAVALLVSLPAAEVSHRFGRKPLIVLSGVLGAIGTVGLILSPYGLLPDFATAPLAALFSVPRHARPGPVLRHPGGAVGGDLPLRRLGLRDRRHPPTTSPAASSASPTSPPPARACWRASWAAS